MTTNSRKTVVSLLLFLSVGLFFGLTVHAQTLIRVVEDESKTKTVSLGGKAEAVFVSSQENLFIETSRPSLDKKKSSKKSSSGLWEYTIELQLQTQEGLAASRSFTITQAGSANKTTFRKGNFAPNKRYVFRVEAVKNPIFLVDNTQPTDVHLKNGEAVVEINSIVDIKVNVHPELSCQVNHNFAQAGYYSTELIIDMVAYDQLRSDVRRQQMIYEDLNESLLDRAEHQEEVTDSEWDNLLKMQQQKEVAEARLADVSLIRVKAKDSNELDIDISDLQAKQKRIYTIETGKFKEEEAKPHWMLLANYGFSPVRQHSLGFTLAWAGRFGGSMPTWLVGRFSSASAATK